MAVKNSENFTFNGIDLQQALLAIGVKFKVNNTEGRGTLASEVDSYKDVASDGGRLLSASLPFREIKIEYTLVAQDLVSIRKAEELINRTLITTEECPLVFEDQEGFYSAIFSGNDIGLDEYNVQQGSLIFTCHKPFRYGNTFSTTHTVVRNTAKSVTVNGGYKVSPIITITLSEAATSLTVNVNGKIIKYNAALTNGTKVIIDSTKMEFRVGGILKVLEVTGFFPSFNVGDNSITLNANAQVVTAYKALYV